MSRFIICRASAGSGKTYTLVRQFIEIAISASSDEQLQKRFSQILAITFTNKAANGMKERILASLNGIVMRKKKWLGLTNEIAGHLGVGSDEVVRRCAVVQSAILHRYSDFSVCTIDSFVHRLVRTFAHDLGLPMNFNIQIDQKEIVQSVVDELLSLAGNPNETQLTKLLCAFSQSKMDEGKGYKVDNEILDLSKEIFSEEAPEYLSLLEKIDLDGYVEIRNRLIGDIQRYRDDVVGSATAFVEACNSAGLAVDDFPSKGSSVLAFFQQLANGNIGKLDDAHKRVDTAYSEGRLYAKSTPQGLVGAFDAVLPAFNRAYETIQQGAVRYNTNRLLVANLYALALLGKINAIKNQYYSENEIVHISEFNKRLDQEIANEPAPFIYERIGSRYHNYLIDEFQDTSRLQWLKFLPLIDEAMTYDFHSTPEVGTQSLVVGDVKQAIYRFRQGDVRQFAKLPAVDSRLHGASIQHEARVDHLVVNRRTLANIVNFNNRFFASIVNGQYQANPELHNLYVGEGFVGSDGHHHPELYQETLGEGGYVQLSFSAKEDICPAVLAAIRHQVDDLHYSYGDIMVLARKNDTLVGISDHLVAYAGDKPVPVVSSESFVLSNSKAVLLLQSALEYIYDPRDRNAALDVLHFAVQCGCLQPDVDPSQAYNPQLYWQLHDASFDLARFLVPYGILLNLDQLRSLSLYDICEELVRIFRLDDVDSAYVASFLNVVASYMQHARPDLANFITYLGDNIGKLSCSTASGLDAVQLMTVHKAKGLESKIVILVLPRQQTISKMMWVRMPEGYGSQLPVAFVSQQSSPTAFSDVFQQEHLMEQVDDINVLYVALTRPEQKLIVVCEDAGKEGYASLLQNFASGDSEFVKHSDSLFTIGDDFERPASKDNDNDDSDQPPTQMPIDATSFPKWEKRVRIADQNSALLTSLHSDNRRFGIIVHDLLAHIFVPDDIQPVVQAFCRQHHIADDDAQSIVSRITAMVCSDRYSRYFDPRYSVKNEASIVVNGHIRRPDRIVFAPDQTWVVDFKTGAFDPETHRKYQNQVDEYAAALTAMGYPNVQTEIIYL